MVCADGSPIAAIVGFPIVAPTGAEVVAGSTRMKAGTATKLLLNMLSTASIRAAGARLPRRDGRDAPHERKLRRRAERIVRDILGVGDARAKELLLVSGWELPVALVAGKWGLAPAAARERIAGAGGNVAMALEEKGGQS